MRRLLALSLSNQANLSKVCLMAAGLAPMTFPTNSPLLKNNKVGIEVTSLEAATEGNWSTSTL